MSCLLIILLSFFPVVGATHAQSNIWIWTPASGYPDAYLVYKRVVEQDWELYSRVPAIRPEGETRPSGVPEGVPYCEIVSNTEESYHVRIVAADAAGNWSPPSEASERLHVILTSNAPPLRHVDRGGE